MLVITRVDSLCLTQAWEQICVTEISRIFDVAVSRVAPITLSTLDSTESSDVVNRVTQM